MIELRDLEKQFDTELVLSQINLRISTGEFVAILGPSGCGKSTLLRIAAGLEEPTKGTCSWHRSSEGAEVPKSDAGQRSSSMVDAPRTAFVFQEPNLLPWRRVARNIALPLELSRSYSNPAVEQLVSDSLRRVGLSQDDGRKFPMQLSGGMKMRASLARALVTSPSLMLMDEPFAALDDMLRQQLNEDVVELWQLQNWTTLFVTHNVAEAIFLSQRVVIMGRNPGRIVTQVPVPFPYPRRWSLRSQPEFAALTGRVGELLREADA